MTENMPNMREMTMRRDDLLDHLRENLETHRATFLKAQEGYRRAVIEELDRMLDDARSGRLIRRAISLPEPEDHSGDYQTAIRMLEMSVGDEITITVDDFEKLVMDNWGWKGRWHETTSSYT